jgi:hypothetical protein
MRGIPAAVLATAGMLMPAMPAMPAAAEAPVAVVEEVKSKSAGVEYMDYVAAGKVIKLAPKDSIVLGYLKSCWRETITGGTVVVGAEQSMVYLGQVDRVKVECEPEKMQLTDQQASQSAGMAFRSTPLYVPGQDAPQARVTLYGLSPIVEVAGGGTLIVERIDKQGERYVVAPSAQPLVRGVFYDFAKTDKALAPGGVYRASLGTREIIFKVHAQAKPGSTPIAGRLLRFSAS